MKGSLSKFEKSTKSLDTWKAIDNKLISGVKPFLREDLQEQGQHLPLNKPILERHDEMSTIYSKTSEKSKI